ncbi:serine/threonine-protein kinase [Aestuariibius sp. 2305UL40-4]|uniref:serine/threonine-protein kinase n=1 Tax=Aestuariibius violaceus TaxID=3234132 RepID=UPI00345EFB5B
MGADKAAEGKRSAIPIGTMINNNYEITDQISSGGMGEVYRGVNAFTGDPVAIKIVLESLSQDEKVATLFKREARILCQLSDRAIVRYYNFVRDEGLDRFCLIMEFIDGISLSDHVRKNGPISVEEAKRLMKRLAQGLDEAHGREVTHRDLSPDNVMLRDGKIDEAVLIDFGIAKSTELTEGTLHGQLAGKFKYISPEQLGHYDGEIGPRTDVYGFGLMIAAAVIGTPLDMGGSVVEAVNARRSVPDLSEVPDELQPVLAKMLEPDPDDRPPRMLDVIALLDAKPEPLVLDQTIIQPADKTAEPSTPPQTQPPSGEESAGSDSPFGAPPPAAAGVLTGATAPPAGSGFVPTSPAPHTPRTLTVPPPSRKKRNVKRSGSRWTMLLALLLIIVGGLAAMQGPLQSILPGSWFASDANGAGGGGGEGVASASGTPAAMTREGFLAAFAEGDCTFATRVRAGPNTGLIETFATELGQFGGLRDAYEDEFGARPDLLQRVVAEGHCPAVNFARRLQADGGTGPILLMDASRVEAGGTVSGTLTGTDGDPVWLFLISTKGGIYNLTAGLEPSPDGSARFAFGLDLAAGETSEPQLIAAVTSEASLTSAATAVAGAVAGSLLPLVADEIASTGGGGVTLGYFLLERTASEGAPVGETAPEETIPDTGNSGFVIQEEG